MVSVLEDFEISIRIACLESARARLEHGMRDPMNVTRIRDIRSLRSVTEHLIDLRARQADLALSSAALRFA